MRPVRIGLPLLALALLASACRPSASQSDLDVVGTTALSRADVAPVRRQELPTDLSLPEATREYIWDLEHHGNLLSQYGFKPIGVCLKSGDAAGLVKMLAPGFRGEVYAEVTRLEYDHATVHARREMGVENSRRPLTGDEFAAWLVEQASGLAEVAGTQFGVKNIGPVVAGDIDGSWAALVALRIWGRTVEGGLAERTALLRIHTLRPTQENLEAGGWLQSCDIAQTARSEAAGPLLVDHTAAWGLDPKGLHDNWESKNKLPITGGVYAADFNHDGYVDVLITDESPQFETLYQGGPEGRFQEATEAAGLRSPTSMPRSSVCAAFVDIDGDGWEDLLYGDGVVLRNDGGRRFRDATGLSNFALTTRVSNPLFRQSICGIIPADFDRDGRIDLFITRVGTKPTSWLSATNERYFPNQLLRNVGDWRFEDVTQKMKLDGDGRSTFAAAWLDFNNDAWPDLYIINEFGDGLLYLNDKGVAFQQRDLTDDVEDFGSMGLAVGDVDNDGLIDVYVAAMYSKAGSRIIGNLPDDAYAPEVMRRLRGLVDGSELYRNRGQGKFSARGQFDQVHDVGWAWGPALADFNNDGWLDLYATAGYMSRERSKPDG